MNFNLTPEQRAIQTAAREFANKEFDSSLAVDLEKQHAFPERIYQKAAELGAHRIEAKRPTLNEIFVSLVKDDKGGA